MSIEQTGRPPPPPGMGQGKEQSPVPLARERGRFWARGEAAAASSEGFNRSARRRAGAHVAAGGCRARGNPYSRREPVP